ncbi:hypothetical protein NC651_040106 [Populus alba x Populus x berolinensis]|nr:hypothetical protein NC651_040106 [Populus alba x Populus x berolinensis]
MQKTKRSAWNTGVFSKMSRLRLLRIRNACFDSGPEYLSNELRFLEWRNYPSKYLPSSFQPENLVEVHLCYSNLRQLRFGNKILDSLKVIDLSYSEYLIKTPDFTGIPNLERLILEGCRRLSEVHSSIGHHNKLIYVNLIDCKSLTSLPSRISGLKLLEELHLSGCSKLKEFPEIEGNKKCLRKLCLDQTSIEELPLSIQYLVGLISLSLKDCKKLYRLPSSINGLKSLKTLHLSGCSELENLPENLGQLECLNELDVSGTAIREPPVSIFSLTNLKKLSFHGCAESSRSTTNIWQRLMFPLMPRKRATSTSLVLPSLSGLSSLTELDLRNCNLGEGAVPNDIGYLSSLRHLDLSCNKFVSLPTSIDQLSVLQCLRMEDCEMLQSLPQLPPNLQSFSVNGCTSLEKMQFSSNPCKFTYLISYFINCWRMSESDCWNNMFPTLLRKFFQGPRDLIESSIIIPGSEIPTWFSHQREGSSMSVPPHSLENDEWLGYAICASLEYDECASSETCADFPYGPFLVPVLFVSGNWNETPFVLHSGCGMKWKPDNISSDHLWYLFIKKKLFDFSFRFVSYWPKIKVIKCGVRLVYHQDVEGLNRMTNLYENSTFEGVDECFQESGGSTMCGGSALVKRLGHINDVGEASGSVSSDEQPPPKS